MRIAAINFFQFDLDKPLNYPQYCNEKCTSAPVWKSRVKCPCHFPAFRRPCFFSHNIKLFGLLLSAVTLSLHYLPRCLRSTVTGDKTPIAASWSEPLKNYSSLNANKRLLTVCQLWNHDNHHPCMGLSCYSCHVQLSRTCIPNLSCDYFNQSCSAEGKIDKAQKCMLCIIIHFRIVFRHG